MVVPKAYLLTAYLRKTHKQQGWATLIVVTKVTSQVANITLRPKESDIKSMENVHESFPLYSKIVKAWLALLYE